MTQRRPPVDIVVSEAGLCDGLRALRQRLPSAARQAWVAAEAAAGVRDIEIGTFAPPGVLPQMADVADAASHVLGIAGLTVAARVPNFLGAERAIAAGVHRIALPLFASEADSLRQMNRTHAQMLREVRRIAQRIGAVPRQARPRLQVRLEMAFGCALAGPMGESAVACLAEALMAAGCEDIVLCDTPGCADPRQVRRLTQAVREAGGVQAVSGIHLANTRGLGLANALTAVEAGVPVVHASLGGLGGNVVTEDLVFLLEAVGLRTGIDLPALLAARTAVAQYLPGVTLQGFTPVAGLPAGFPPAPPAQLASATKACPMASDAPK
ncbi:Hydroxymethylglutaryl-CoA lyase YngG [Cupriavidus laharis]|uniref:Hydroxymethylglutaryl-CoA lyase YngG n=1 Tax=Cupriavidus laharis TaxID=151654 RepID=A0ABN7ZA36_9BURK|nr:hydroxymethylglutaryl-CoA lyase [Cupriavidus laharis]CAG9182833.1 Hydroxymethylglutaryl-CoA lyase YngG [Cupriavidus laharis]